MKHCLKAAAAAALALAAGHANACSSCGCTLTSDWINQGLVAVPGTTIDLRYDYVPQTDLRAGTLHLDRARIALPTDRETEVSTFNHYATVGIDRSWASGWGVDVQLPLVARPHRTVAEGDTDISRSDSQGLGDVRATVRYQGFAGPGITGLEAGLKLPTGGFNQVFRSGPQAGSALDRGLQAGSGTTDAIVGAYHFGNLAPRLSYFAQALAIVPLGARRDFQPGVNGTVAAGVDLRVTTTAHLQLQTNLKLAAQDSGRESDRANSGGELLYLSPGGSVAIGRRLTAFGFVQLPLYERVTGQQLTPRVTVSAGLRFRL